MRAHRPAGTRPPDPVRRVAAPQPEGISRITAFGDPELVTAFGFPAVPPADGAG